MPDPSSLATDTKTAIISATDQKKTEKKLPANENVTMASLPQTALSAPCFPRKWKFFKENVDDLQQEVVNNFLFNKAHGNHVIVRIWLPKTITEAGHVSLETCTKDMKGGVYASFWPMQDFTFKNTLKSVPGKFFSHDDDKIEKKHEPDHKIIIYGLNITKINELFLDLKSIESCLKWSLDGSSPLRNKDEFNCCSVVLLLLLTGAGGRYNLYRTPPLPHNASKQLKEMRNGIAIFTLKGETTFDNPQDIYKLAKYRSSIDEYLEKLIAYDESEEIRLQHQKEQEQELKARACECVLM